MRNEFDLNSSAGRTSYSDTTISKPKNPPNNRQKYTIGILAGTISNAFCLGHCWAGGVQVAPPRYIKGGGKQWVVTSAPPPVQSTEANSYNIQNGKRKKEFKKIIKKGYKSSLNKDCIQYFCWFHNH